MSRNRWWRAAAVIFLVTNIGGAAYAAWMGEGMHAGFHVVLAFLGAWWVSKVREGQPVLADGLPITDERLGHLEQSIDDMALQVERLGEAQRFALKLEQERQQRARERRNDQGS